MNIAVKPLEISAAQLAEHRIFVASPQFGGQCHTIFCRGLADLALICGMYRIPFDHAYIWNESLIPRARNYLVDTFLGSPATHMMFIDSDIGFRAQDVLALLTLAVQNPEYEIIGAPYLKKEPGTGYAFNSGEIDMNAKDPVEVDGIGTGFMLIARGVFDKFRAAYPQYLYRPDCGPYDGSREIMQYFQAEIDQESRRYLSEDFWFSKRCAALGIRTWLCLWMKLRHAGSFIFE